jgi:hypothetical protein
MYRANLDPEISTWEEVSDAAEHGEIILGLSTEKTFNTEIHEQEDESEGDSDLNSSERHIGQDAETEHNQSGSELHENESDSAETYEQYDEYSYENHVDDWSLDQLLPEKIAELRAARLCFRRVKVQVILHEIVPPGKSMKMILTNIAKIGAPSNSLPRRGLSCAQRDCASNAKGRAHRARLSHLGRGITFFSFLVVLISTHTDFLLFLVCDAHSFNSVSASSGSAANGCPFTFQWNPPAIHPYAVHRRVLVLLRTQCGGPIRDANIITSPHQ